MGNCAWEVPHITLEFFGKVVIVGDMLFLRRISRNNYEIMFGKSYKLVDD
jgi:hypothetical protein